MAMQVINARLMESLAKVEISSESHPFFTGQMKIVDTAGRAARFATLKSDSVPIGAIIRR